MIFASVHSQIFDNGQNVNSHPISHSPSSGLYSPRLQALAFSPFCKFMTLHFDAVEIGQAADRFILNNDYTLQDNHKDVHICSPIMSVFSVRFQTIHVLGVQESSPWFIIQTLDCLYWIRNNELFIVNPQHAKYSWQKIHALEKVILQIQSILTINTSFRRQKCGIDSSSESSY